MTKDISSEILIQAWNVSTGVYETIEREVGSYDDLVAAELSATDLGCDPGSTYRLLQVDEEDRVINERFVKAL